MLFTGVITTDIAPRCDFNMPVKDLSQVEMITSKYKASQAVLKTLRNWKLQTAK